ncbi:MAG: serine protease Do [Candidatus Parcubacteria bacterium]|jgi:hypothetical protein|nr:serine protease Do [Candidatus Parcubacteria bacterium]
MDIEDLSKAQLLLLTVLVNFVVSIATGVLTVSFLDQAPANITQTVNRIVDHTVETISTPIQVATTAVKPTPAAPSGEQLLTTAISASVNRTVLIHRGATTTPAILYGTYLPKQRAVATVTGVATLPKEATIVFANGQSSDASLVKQGGGIAIYGFSDTAALPDAPASNFVSFGDLKPGQTAIAITRDSAALTGIVSKVDNSGILTSLAGIPPGAAAVSLSGAVIGIQGLTAGLFIPTDSVTALLAETP